jgi:hypothetical protein
MSVVQMTDNTAPARAHAAACNASEATRQVAISAASTQAAAKAADIAHYRNCRASAIANNNGAGVEQFAVALRELGTGGS